MKPFPEAHELLELFEVEPTLLDPGVPWVYNTLTFATERERQSIECTIVPGYGELRLSWSSQGVQLVDVKMDGVLGLRVELSSKRNALIATASDAELVVQLNPHVHVSWSSSSK